MVCTRHLWWRPILSCLPCKQQYSQGPSSIYLFCYCLRTPFSWLPIRLINMRLPNVFTLHYLSHSVWYIFVSFYFKDLICILSCKYECFTWIYVQGDAGLEEARRGHPVSWTGVRAVCCHVGAGNQKWVIWKSVLNPISLAPKTWIFKRMWKLCQIYRQFFKKSKSLPSLRLDLNL